MEERRDGGTEGQRDRRRDGRRKKVPRDSVVQAGMSHPRFQDAEMIADEQERAPAAEIGRLLRGGSIGEKAA